LLNGPWVATVTTLGYFQANPIPPTIHTCRGIGNNAVRFPSGVQQARVLDRLFHWFVVHAWRKPVAMTSEPSVQDEVHAQIIEPLNMLLEVCILHSGFGHAGPSRLNYIVSS
jgi:hypothetical protein